MIPAATTVTASADSRVECVSVAAWTVTLHTGEEACGPESRWQSSRYHPCQSSEKLKKLSDSDDLMMPSIKLYPKLVSFGKFYW